LFKALAKQPEHRYADMDAFHASLGRLAAGEKAAQIAAAPQQMDMPMNGSTQTWFGGGETVDLSKQSGTPQADPMDMPAHATQAAWPQQTAEYPPAYGQQGYYPYGQPSIPLYPPSFEKTKKKSLVWVWVSLAGFVSLAVIVVVILSSYSGTSQPPTGQAVGAPTQPSTALPIATPSMPSNDTNALSSCTQIGQRWTNPVDGSEMICVSAGEFWMGAAQGDGQAEDDERPGRMVYLDAYWIDRYEVTNSQYQACEIAGVCSSPGASGSITRGSYYGNPSFANYPVIYVDWYQANAYCEWAGERLPSEAQWEKAARGTDGRIYPWGNDKPDCNKANYLGCQGTIDNIGKHAMGVSPYGAQDMLGNVWEWTSDWYRRDYYAISGVSINPPGPALTIGKKVVRGGCWMSYPHTLRSAFRDARPPDNHLEFIGFRCALLLS